jgi:adenosylmethionine-8-amino-7-oxononanoate aminotransferase
MLEHDVLLRPIGNTVYILPPYCIDKADLERIYETLWRAMDAARDARADDVQEQEQRAA